MDYGSNKYNEATDFKLMTLIEKTGIINFKKNNYGDIFNKVLWRN